MPDYTNFLGLYKPSRNDNLALDTSLADNFSAIDTKLGSALKDDTGKSFANLNDRLKDIIDKISSSGVTIDLKAYGASGNRNTDDTAIINQALEEIYQRGGGTLLVGKGDYKLTTEVIVKSNTRILAMDSATFYKDHGGYMLMNAPLGSQEFGGFDGHSNIIIEGGTWDARGADLKVMHNTFAFGHGQNIVFRNLTIKDTAGSHAIEINAIKDCAIENCRFLGLYDTGGREFSEAVQMDLMKGSAFFGSFGKYDHTPCNNVIVSNCYFGASGTAGTIPWGRGIGSHSATIGIWHENFYIVNNMFEKLGCQCVRGYNWRNVLIHGNVMYDCGAAVQINVADTSDPKDTETADGTVTNQSQNIHNITISDNIVRGGGRYTTVMGIKGEATGIIYNVTITGNKITDISSASAGTTIQLSFVRSASVANNIVSGGAYTAIDVIDTKNVVIEGNVIGLAGDNGIRVRENTEATTVKGNQVQRSGNLGIYITGGAKWVIVDGNIVTNSAGSFNIAITSGVSYINVIGNMLQKDGGTNGGCQLTSSCNNAVVMGNNWGGLSNSITLTTTIVNANNL